MPDTLNLACPACGAVNRVPAQRLGEGPSCGKCHQPILEPRPYELDAAGFKHQLMKSDLPLVVDFWASWCGLCKMMAPAFAEAAGLLHPQARLAKINTEAEQGLAQAMGISSIPTMVLFKGGREAARVSGAMSAAQIQSWVRSNL